MVMIGELKQMTDTYDKQTVGYHTTSKATEGLSSTTTKSFSTLVLLNKFNPKMNEHIEAINDRGHVLHFIPTNAEVMKYAEKHKLANKEIRDFIRKYHKVCKNFSFRLFIKAEDHYKMGKEWKHRVMQLMELDQKLMEIQKLLETYKSDKEREKHYSGSRMDYFRWKKKFLEGSAGITKKGEA